MMKKRQWGPVTRIFVRSLNTTYLAVNGHVAGPKRRQSPRAWDEIVKEFEKPDEKYRDLLPDQVDSNESLIDFPSDEKECATLNDAAAWWVEPLRKVEDFEVMEVMF